MLPLFKSDNDTFGYVSPRNTNPICGRCKYFVRRGQCLLVKGSISGANGSCNFWIGGQPRFHPINTPPLTKQESVYVETPKGPRCGTCAFYDDPRGCGLVKGDIDPNYGCCNAWKKKEGK